MTETVLAICGHEARPVDLRRGLCVSCYRKLRAEGCPLPPRARRWDRHDGLAAWALSLPAEMRARLLTALAAQDASRAQSTPAPPIRTHHRVTTA